MGFLDAVKAVYSNYANFHGRAGRAEYWWFFLFYLVVAAALAILGEAIGVGDALVAIFALGSLLPVLAVGARRLHDRGQSAWWLLLNLVPFGALVLLVMYALKGAAGDNRFGPDPRASAAPTDQGPATA